MNRIVITLATLSVVCPIADAAMARQRSAMSPEEANATAKEACIYGYPMVMGVWEIPDFDPAERAFYYVHVLEIPTPTWLAYDKAFYTEASHLPDDALLVHQERAYTSPIWYTPLVAQQDELPTARGNRG